MKSKLKTFSSVSLLTLLIAFTPVIATAQGTETETETSNQTVQTTAVETEAEVESTPEQLKARLDKRKAALKTKIDAAKQARLKARCKASQGKLNSISGRINGLKASRTQVYKNTLDRLTSLSEKLAVDGADNTQLNSQITQLTGLVEAFNTELAEYKESVADLAKMDCTADPIAFQASLEAARTARTETADSAKAIRAFLKDTIKPTLSQLRAGLGEKTESNEAE